MAPLLTDTSKSTTIFSCVWLLKRLSGGRNSSVGSVLGSLSCVMQHHRFDLPWSLSEEGLFPLELTCVLTPLPTDSFRLEYKLRSSLCIHAFNHTNSKDPYIHVIDGWMLVTNTPSTYHPWRQNVTTSMVGLKNGYICNNLTKNGEPQRYSWESKRRKKVWVSCKVTA